jgi:hypothetical protein
MTIEAEHAMTHTVIRHELSYYDSLAQFVLVRFP